MADVIEKSPSTSFSDLREVTLRIPGEHFFCESLSLPNQLIAQIKKGDEGKSVVSVVQNYIEGLLDDSFFSPYPAEQLAWGYHYCDVSYKVLLFAAPYAKLSQLGWDNFELFRRIFPSFVSLLGNIYDESTLVLFIFEETLTAASFSPKSSVPDELFSHPFDPSDEDSFESARGKLLSLMNLSAYPLSSTTLVAGEVTRSPDGFFEFEHYLKDGREVALRDDYMVRMPADDLWNHDLRSPAFKNSEKIKRLKERGLWRGFKLSSVLLVVLLLSFVTYKVFEFGQRAQSLAADEMAKEVPLVLESQKLLEKLKQNKLGGIDPFGAIERLSIHRGGTTDRPNLWFSKAHFETRNHVKLEGEGVNVESVNTFISNFEGAGVAQLRKSRSGEEYREIKSDGGKTTFEIQINLLEEEPAPLSVEDGDVQQ